MPSQAAVLHARSQARRLRRIRVRPGQVNHILGGPDYSTVNGACVEGDRMIVALMRMPAGTGAETHSHPNEQWIYILQGTFKGEVEGQPFEAKAGSVLYIPSNAMHAGKATPDADVVFFTVQGRLAQPARHQGRIEGS